MEKTYQIKISLKSAKPPIWRRVLIPSDLLLPDLHHVIQYSMGWYDCHLHQFEAGEEYYVPKEEDIYNPFELLEKTDYSDIAVEDLLKHEKDKMLYTYDFGDRWDHDIILEKIIDTPFDKDHPVCIKGKGACPPEDCGGIWGYAEFIEIMKDPKHPEYEDMKEWHQEVTGEEEFDPSYFDIDETNEMLNPNSEFHG